MERERWWRRERSYAQAVGAGERGAYDQVVGAGERECMTRGGEGLSRLQVASSSSLQEKGKANILGRTNN
jgi:hypothetical protein